MKIIYEDNHIIVVNKEISEIVQNDKTGDISLADKVKIYIKQKYNKSGNVFLGIVHRLDRPTSGIVVFARTSKALSRLNEMFRLKEVEKIYLAVVDNMPKKSKDTLKHYLIKNEKQNKSYAHDIQKIGTKLSVMSYNLIAQSQRYFLLEVNLQTGRHHQIRVQLAKIGCKIKGDLKYGFPRSNKNKGIHLHAYKIKFTHPVSKKTIALTAKFPEDNLWHEFEKLIG